MTLKELTSLRPKGWVIPISAAFGTWVVAAILGVVVSVPFTALRYVVPFSEDSVVGSIWFLIDGLAYLLKISYLISWIPLILMIPVVKWLCEGKWNHPVSGALIGATVAPAFIIAAGIARGIQYSGGIDLSRITAAPMMEVYFVSSIIGAIMGAINFFIARQLQRRRATDTPINCG